MSQTNQGRSTGTRIQGDEFSHGMCRKNVEFYEDKGLDPRFRSRLSDFRDSGYDRGHMVRPNT